MADTTITEALAEAARNIDATHDLSTTLQVIADSARISIPGIDHAGISTIDTKGVISTRAATGPIVRQLDDLQYSLNEGPCVDAIRLGGVVAVPDLRLDRRWPRYVAEAVPSTGLTAQLAVQLFLSDEGTVGGLNLYSTSSTAIDDEAVEIAEAFAVHAALAFGHARRVEQLTDGMRSRKLIGQALGLLMERFEITEDQAFAYLTRASSHGNIKLREIAAELVSQAEHVGRGEPVGRGSKPS